jgi:CBS domain-containing protein
MNKVEVILSRKGGKPISVTVGTTVIDALRLMSTKNVGSVVVTDTDGKYQGIVSERDYSRKIVLHGKSSTDTKVEEIMSDSPKISPHDTAEYCMQLMSDRNTRYLPVFSGDELVGIISMSDVVKETILAQQETIDQLKQYISL